MNIQKNIVNIYEIFLEINTKYYIWGKLNQYG